MKLNLPVHPTMCHPLTGEPLRALYVDSKGRARYPMMGGDETADAAAAKATTDAAAAKSTADAKAAADAAAAKAAEAGKTGEGDKGGAGEGEGDKPTGFPANTPRAQMKPTEQLAYDAFHGRKHEQRATEYREAAGGKTAAEVKAELAEYARLKAEKMTDGEKAVETAKAEGRREASLAVAPQMFDVALAHVEEDRRKVLIDNIDLTKVIKEDGTVDTAKVQTIAASLAPTGKGQGTGQFDFGGGRRSGGADTGVSAGRSRYQERHGKKTAD